MALLTTEDVLEKTFNIVKFREGYDQVEVDDFLDEVVSTIYTLQAENQNLREELEAAERRVAELSGGEAPSYKPAEETAAPVVEEPVASEPSVTETAVAAPAVAVAPESAESDRIIADANAKRDEIIADAQNQHQNILSQLDQERALLEGKINELRSFESEYRANLREHLEGLLQEVNAGTQN